MTLRIDTTAAVLVLCVALAACKPGTETPRSPAATPSDTAGAAPAPSSTATPSSTVSKDTGFRATGNEPGWMAQVTAGASPSLHAEVDYGERKFDISPVAEQADGWTGKSADGTAIVLKFERRACQDSMSGQAFEAVATLTVGDRSYQGCGKFNPQ
ncbi:putative membrane protein [Lysobacter niastensis]|uniref:Membrane protein n=1 Tax=Lysobacter niastensis TaxID=380629 RepID=A0ABU1WEG4_9GAMM|nr:hypothetical protein [Lysobacter niastensis]MDR7135996.1 putative membrane protein [Lysobacter niastensis]